MNSRRPVFLLTSLLTTTSLLTSGRAAVLAETSFDSAVKSGSSQTMTEITWTGENLAAFTPSSSVTTAASNNSGYFTTGFGATGFAPDQNIENEGPWTATFEFTLASGTTVTLTDIFFNYAALTNSGASQGTNFRAQNFDISVNGSAFDDQKQTTAVNGSLAFTDSVAFNPGLNSVTITASEVSGAGYNMGIDNLSFEGDLTVIPEPSALVLGGLGLCALVGRRRRMTRS